MRITLLLIFLSSVCFGQDRLTYEQEVIKHRTEKDASYKDTAHSPLSHDQIAKFEGLSYFAPDASFRIEAKFKKDIGDPFEMATSSGVPKKFRRYGVLKFKINGKKCRLHVYQNMQLMLIPMYKDYAFLPFTDLTNFEESYGGGRFIETTLPTSDTFIIDFNYCFNPYCHYTDGYSCPIPPLENHLKVKVLAGEKKFSGAKH